MTAATAPARYLVYDGNAFAVNANGQLIEAAVLASGAVAEEWAEINNHLLPPATVEALQVIKVYLTHLPEEIPNP